MSLELSLFVEEQLLLTGVFEPSSCVDLSHRISNHLANLQLTYGLTLVETYLVFLVSIHLVGFKSGLVDVASLVTQPLADCDDVIDFDNYPPNFDKYALN